MSEDEIASRKKTWSLDQESFDRLMAWLDPNPEAAGRKYEEIRVRLTKILVRRSCYVAEELADEAINRVARKLPEIQENYVGDPALYFCGVAGNVFLEWVKKRPVSLPIPAPDPPEVLEANHRCLDKCLDELDPSDREVMLDYFKEEGRAKINLRNAMAKKLGMSINALRTHACRVKKALKECVIECIRCGEQ